MAQVELCLQEVTFGPEGGEEEEGAGRGHCRCKDPEAGEGEQGEGVKPRGHVGPRRRLRAWASLLKRAGRSLSGFLVA